MRNNREELKFSDILLDWYRKNGRDLPWRATADPYRIWISEIILQQTRVEQGKAYYDRFLCRFPTVDALAAAPEDEVMREWQGLGYYSRARNLHAAAKSLAGKPFPRTFEALKKLKGVGDYTAAAIASIAFGEPCAVVDGNVYRLLSRYFAIDTAIDTAAGKKGFAALASELLDPACPGLYNQAAMDFGALQCVPVSPRCDRCPLSGGCAAFAESRAGALPVKKGKVKTRDRYFHYFIAVSDDGRCFIRKRAGGDIWRGLWEFPLIETASSAGLEKVAATPQWRVLFGKHKPKVSVVRQGVRHLLTHQRLFADIYRAVLPAGADIPGHISVPTSTLDNYAFPRLLLPFLPCQRKI